MWRVRPVLKHFKVPKYYAQNCLKIFLLFSAFPVMIEVLEKVLIWLKKVSFIKSKFDFKVKLQLKPNFNLSKVLHKTIKSWTLTQLNCFIFLLKIRKMLWCLTKCGEKIRPSCDQNAFAQTVPEKIFETK